MAEAVKEAGKAAADTVAKTGSAVWGFTKGVGKAIFNRYTIGAAALAATTMFCVAYCPPGIWSTTIAGLKPMTGAGIMANSGAVLSNSASLASATYYHGGSAILGSMKAGAAASTAGAGATIVTPATAPAVAPAATTFGWPTPSLS